MFTWALGTAYILRTPKRELYAGCSGLFNLLDNKRDDIIDGRPGGRVLTVECYYYFNTLRLSTIRVYL